MSQQALSPSGMTKTVQHTSVSDKSDNRQVKGIQWLNPEMQMTLY